MFCEKNSIHEILNTEGVSDTLYLLYPEMLLNVVPDEYLDKPIGIWKDRVMMPWGSAFLSDAFLQAANLALEIHTDHIFRFVPLWTDKQNENYIPDFRRNDKSSVCLITSNIMTDDIRPAVIIVPGGGYQVISTDTEGLRIAEYMEAHGYRAFVLNYRVSPNCWPVMQTDLLLAIKHVRKNAALYRIEPGDLMVMGFSAGGHLCASASRYVSELEPVLMKELQACAPTLADVYQDISAVPDKLCLGYPVISFTKEQHEDSFQSLTAGNEQLREKLSLEINMQSGFPRTFLWACEDDALVPVSNTVRFYDALTAQDIPCRMRLYPTGGHGCGLAHGCSAEPWTKEMLLYMKGSEAPADPSYFGRYLGEDTWLIGCNTDTPDGRSGYQIDFGNPTGNSWLIVGTKEAVLIDTAAELPGIRAFAESIAQKPVKLVLSHAHPDHTFRLTEFDECWMHPADKALLHGAYGWTPAPSIPETIHYLRDRMVLDIGNGHALEVHHMKGHTDGSILLYDRKTKLLFTGDSIARRLLYGTCAWEPVTDYIRRLKEIQKLDIRGICSCHDRRILDPGQIDFMIQGFPALTRATEEIQYTPDMTPLVYSRLGKDKDMFFLDISYPKTETCIEGILQYRQTIGENPSSALPGVPENTRSNE